MYFKKTTVKESQAEMLGSDKMQVIKLYVHLVHYSNKFKVNSASLFDS